MIQRFHSAVLSSEFCYAIVWPVTLNHFLVLRRRVVATHFDRHDRVMPKYDGPSRSQGLDEELHELRKLDEREEGRIAKRLGGERRLPIFRSSSHPAFTVILAKPPF